MVQPVDVQVIQVDVDDEEDDDDDDDDTVIAATSKSLWSTPARINIRRPLEERS